MRLALNSSERQQSLLHVGLRDLTDRRDRELVPGYAIVRALRTDFESKLHRGITAKNCRTQLRADKFRQDANTGLKQFTGCQVSADKRTDKTRERTFIGFASAGIRAFASNLDKIDCYPVVNVFDEALDLRDREVAACFDGQFAKDLHDTPFRLRVDADRCQREAILAHLLEARNRWCIIVCDCAIDSIDRSGDCDIERSQG